MLEPGPAPEHRDGRGTSRRAVALLGKKKIRPVAAGFRGVLPLDCRPVAVFEV